jgi:hypothetical protein
MLLRVQAAHAKIAHWVMNSGYRIKKGGVGTVNIIVTEQPILMNHAKISRKQRRGLLRQSSLIQATMLKINSFKLFPYDGRLLLGEQSRPSYLV